MKTSVTVNIDTVEFSVRGKRRSFDLPNATIVTVIRPDGEIVDSYQNRTTIPGKHGTHALHVRALHSGEQLHVEGSPYAFLYGQNVFTGADIREVVARSLDKILDHFRIPATAEQREKWCSGDIQLHRVDLAVNFLLPSGEQCLAVLKQVKRQLVEQYGSMKACGTSVYWTPRNGSEYSIGLYAKGPQMRHQMKRYARLRHKEKLLDDCRRVLRVEIRLREPALAMLNLQTAGDWVAGSAQKAFSRYMRRLRIFSITSGPLTKKDIDALPNRRLRPVLALHKAGADLSLVYSLSTLRRHQRDFRKMGFDLKCPNQAKKTVLPLTNILSPKRAIKNPPAWMKTEGLVPSRVEPHRKKHTRTIRLKPDC